MKAPKKKNGIETLGDVLRERRKAQRLTQRDFADALGKNQSTIAKWEIGATAPSELDASEIARVLNINREDVTELIARFKHPTKPHPHAHIEGCYELYQWSYGPDDKIMKSVIDIRVRGNDIVFEEQIKYGDVLATIVGRAEVFGPNLYLYGKGQDHFDECELVIVETPGRTDTWKTGLVAGISSDKLNVPGASRAVMKFYDKKLSHEHKLKPEFGDIKKFEKQIRDDMREYLEEKLSGHVMRAQ